MQVQSDIVYFGRISGGFRPNTSNVNGVFEHVLLGSSTYSVFWRPQFLLTSPLVTNSKLQREWISASTVVLWLGTVTPCVIIAYLVLLDLACRLKPLRRLFRWISVPFTNFLVLEDLLDPIGKTVQLPVWKRHTLVVLPAAEALSWITLFFYTLLVPDSLWVVRSGVSAIIWVRIQRVINVSLFMIADHRAVFRSDLRLVPPHLPHISYFYSASSLSSQQLAICTFLSPGSRSGLGTHCSACSGQVSHSSYYLF